MSSSPSTPLPEFLRAEGSRATELYRPAALAGFLRARRGRIAPDQDATVFDATTRRRVTGLRREELAWMAGVSVDYYTKLEQGRSTHPSPAVVSALAEALQLNDVERRYLRALTALAPVAPADEDRTALAHAEQVLRAVGTQLRHPVMTHLLTADLTITGLDPQSTSVMFPAGRLATNPGADLSLLSYIFHDPVSRQVYVDWASKAREVVGLAHLSLATTAPTPDMLSTLTHLWRTSSALRHLWSHYDPHDKGDGTWRLRIPGEGIVRCAYATIQTAPCRDISLVVYSRSNSDATA